MTTSQYIRIRIKINRDSIGLASLNLSENSSCNDDSLMSDENNKSKNHSPVTTNHKKKVKSKLPVGYDQLDYIIVKEIKRSNNLVDEALKKIEELRYDFDLWRNKDKDKLENAIHSMSQTIKSSLDQVKFENEMFKDIISKDIKQKDRQIKNIVIDLNLVKKNLNDISLKYENLNKPEVENNKFQFSTFSIPEQPSCSTVTSPKRTDYHNLTLDDRSK